MTASSFLKKREEVLDSVLNFIRTMKLDFEYSALPLESIIYAHFSEDSGKNFNFLKNCFWFLQSGKDFPVAWKSAVENETYLSKKEKAKLLTLGSFLGQSSLRQQLEILSVYEEYFKSFHLKAKEQSEKYCKTAVIVGAFSGFGAFIFLI